MPEISRNVKAIVEKEAHLQGLDVNQERPIQQSLTQPCDKESAMEPQSVSDI